MKSLSLYDGDFFMHRRIPMTTVMTRVPNVLGQDWYYIAHEHYRLEAQIEVEEVDG